MSITLPRELDYSTVLPSLSSQTVNTQHTAVPVNGSAFSCATQGNLVIFDLVAQDFLDVNSIFLQYTYTSVSTGETAIRGCPVYSPISRLQVLMNNSVVENISNYNTIMHMKSNTNLDISQNVS